MGQNRLQDIPTGVFNAILKEHLEAGWNKVYEYTGFDAWIDYGRVDLRKGGAALVFEWTNWDEGEIAGPEELISRISREYQLPGP